MIKSWVLQCTLDSIVASGAIADAMAYYLLNPKHRLALLVQENGVWEIVVINGTLYSEYYMVIIPIPQNRTEQACIVAAHQFVQILKNKITELHQQEIDDNLN